MSTKIEKVHIREKNLYLRDKIQTLSPFKERNPLLRLLLISFESYEFNPEYFILLKEYQDSEEMKASWKRTKKDDRQRHLNEKNDRLAKEDAAASLQPIKKKQVKHCDLKKHMKQVKQEKKTITGLNQNRFAVLADQNDF